jgi:hypothetical protein
VLLGLVSKMAQTIKTHPCAIETELTPYPPTPDTALADSECRPVKSRMDNLALRLDLAVRLDPAGETAKIAHIVIAKILECLAGQRRTATRRAMNDRRLIEGEQGLCIGEVESA